MGRIARRAALGRCFGRGNSHNNLHWYPPLFALAHLGYSAALLALFAPMSAHSKGRGRFVHFRRRFHAVPVKDRLVLCPLKNRGRSGNCRHKFSLPSSSSSTPSLPLFAFP